MKTNYFLINGIMYIIDYKDFELEIYKLINNHRYPLSDSEKEYFDGVIRKNSSYIYTSEKLGEVLDKNNKIINKDPLLKYFEWIENIIPEDCRDDFYKNLETLEINRVDGFDKNTTVASYNSMKNMININPNHPHFKNKEEFEQTFVHELLHMASSNFDKETNKVLSGFDEFTTSKFDFKNRNRGLTEVLSMIAVSNTTEYKSGYLVEALLIDQISQLIDNNVILESYFSNKGTAKLENELTKIGFDQEKAFRVFRDIEVNYLFTDDSEKQTTLANIQSSLIDYLDVKCKDIFLNNSNEDEMLSILLQRYEQVLITEDKLKINGKNPDKFIGLDESISKFYDIKNKYTNLLGTMNEQPNLENEISNSKSMGYVKTSILFIISILISIVLLVLGVILID